MKIPCLWLSTRFTRHNMDLSSYTVNAKTISTVWEKWEVSWWFWIGQWFYTVCNFWTLAIRDTHAPNETALKIENLSTAEDVYNVSNIELYMYLYINYIIMWQSPWPLAKNRWFFLHLTDFSLYQQILSVLLITTNTPPYVVRETFLNTFTYTCISAIFLECSNHKIFTLLLIN